MLADGVELIGEYEGSGFKEPPALVRRGDGQVIQLAPLLYEVARRADGHHSYDDIARDVSAAIQRGLDADSVRFLVDEKLYPLGVVRGSDGTQPAVEKADPFLGLKLRAAVIPESVSGRLGTAFKPLFLPLILLAVLGTFAVADWWLFGVHGVAQSLRQTLYHPGLFLPLFGAIVASAVFHEIGHAAACRYGGGHPGKMGCGLYLAWPAFYTDVTDAYRLGRRARLRTDLGGVYFNLVVVLATMGAYLATHFEPLLLLIVVQHVEIVHQLLPVVRLDGYYIVADITGVPDLFARIGPILRSLVPGAKADPRVSALKPWVRVAVTAWVFVVVPLLGLELFVILVHLPRLLGTAWDSGVKGFHAAQHAFAGGNALAGASSSIELVALAIPVVGILLVLAKTAKGAGGWAWRSTGGRPVLRTLCVATAVAGGACLAWSWVSPHNYTPIRPGERGTLTESVRAAVQAPNNLPRAEPPAAPAGAGHDETPAASTTTTTPTSSTTPSRNDGTAVATTTTLATVTTTPGTTVATPTTERTSPTTTSPPVSAP